MNTEIFCHLLTATWKRWDGRLLISSLAHIHYFLETLSAMLAKTLLCSHQTHSSLKKKEVSSQWCLVQLPGKVTLYIALAFHECLNYIFCHVSWCQDRLFTLLPLGLVQQHISVLTTLYAEMYSCGDHCIHWKITAKFPSLVSLLLKQCKEVPKQL